jgi:hypothetical protein
VGQNCWFQLQLELELGLIFRTGAIQNQNWNLFLEETNPSLPGFSIPFMCGTGTKTIVFIL